MKNPEEINRAIKTIGKRRKFQLERSAEAAAAFKLLDEAISDPMQELRDACWTATYKYLASVEGPGVAIRYFRAREDRSSRRARLLVWQAHSIATDDDNAFLAALDRDEDDPAHVGLIDLLRARTQLRQGAVTSTKAQLEAIEAEHCRPDYGAELVGLQALLGCWPAVRQALKNRDFVASLPGGEPRRIRKRLKLARSGRGSIGFPCNHRVVSLERALGRRRGLAERYGLLGLNVDFHPAVDGQALPDDLYESWCPTGLHHRAGVSNGLSQMAVLTDFLASGDSHRLVLEDDAWPFADMALGRSLLDELAPKDFDILYVGVRATRDWFRRPETPVTRYSEALQAVRGRFVASGLEGYIVSRRGAEKLLGNFETHRILGAIDFQVAYYSLDADEHRTLQQPCFEGAFGKFRKNIGDYAPLDSYALHRPLVTPSFLGDSTVVATNMDIRWG